MFSEDCERLLLYCKEPKEFGASRNDLPLSEEVKARYKNPDDDERGAWQSVSLNAQGGHGTKDQFYDFVAPNGKVHKLPEGRCWLYTWPVMQEKIADGRVWFGATGNNAPRQKKFLFEAKAGLTPNTLWLANDVGTNDEAKKDTVRLFGSAVFDTPKPERLLGRVIHIATNPGDLVLDSFLGSGTTAAVAQKMNRRYIGIEMGEHAVTHCTPRLQKVVDGEQGGVSKSQNWRGGGGFRFFRLGPPVFDEDGAIQPDIRFPVLAAHIWFSETETPWTKPKSLTPFLGDHDGQGYALLFNGILGDKSIGGGNVLTRKTLAAIRAGASGYTGPLTVYGERTVLSDASLAEEVVTFKQTPYDVRARK